MAEEQQKLRQPSNHVLCANNCGFFGSPTTLNLCSKCYKDHCLKERQISTAKIAVEKTLTSSPESFNSTASAVVPVSVFPDPSTSVPADGTGTDLTLPSSDAVKPNRCGSCRKRVGLTGFTCKCGVTFCGVHRYPEKHECSFDFKTVGKELIAKANPVVKAAKLDKI